MIDYVWLIPALMFLAALINGLGCRKLGKLAGYISVGAMATTFLLAVGVFLQVKGAAPHVAHGEHAEAEAHAHMPHSGDAAMDYWNHLDHATQEAVKAQYFFARAEDPASPKPWETSFREGNGGYVKLWTWIDIPSALGAGRDLTVDMAFHVDQLTSIFLLFVSFVGMLVFIYATGYMKEDHHGHLELDPGYARFFCYLALFAGSMYTLVLGANFVVMFIGWEGVGLCSYLLIGYFFDKQFSAKLSCADAGKKAFVVNRIGDFGLMLGMFLLFWGFGTVDFQTLIHRFSIGDVPAGFGYGGALITAATLLLFLGATGKSAQIPLFTWLPDAMAGPTPVSALIHAATMVTAGVYMLARLNVLFMFSPTTLAVVAGVGAATAFVAAFVGLTQRGIKKILAYSTVSQLGFMFLAIGVGAFAGGIFHVFTHAFFKACLFLAAGSVIYALHHEEDVFKMGGLRQKMPLTFISYGIATVAIAGVIPFAGFWSKDEILFLTYVAGSGSGYYKLLWVVGVVTAAMTAFYMGRSFVLAFLGKPRMSEEKFSHVHETHISMSGVLVVLAVASALVGFLNVPKDLVSIGGANEMFHHYLAPVTDRGAELVARDVLGMEGYGAKLGPAIAGGLEFEAAKGPAMMLAVLSQVIALGGLGLAFFLYLGGLERARQLASNALLKPLWNVSWMGWWWDDLYDLLFVTGATRLYGAVLWFDKTVVDGIVLGVGRISRSMSLEFRRLQNGQVQVYALLMFIGVCLFLLYFSLGMRTFLDAPNPKGHQISRVLVEPALTPDAVAMAQDQTAAVAALANQ